MKIKKGYHGCSDGGCVFGHPGGMHTNGGCKCLMGEERRIHPNDIVRIRRSIRRLRQERDNLATALLVMLEDHEDCGCITCKTVAISECYNE